MRRQTDRPDRRKVMMEALEDRQMLSCMVGSSTVYFDPRMNLLIQVGGQFTLPNGKMLGPGTYTGADLNSLMSPTSADAPAAAVITLTTNTSTLLRGQSAAMATASVTLAGGTVPTDGAIHFYTARPTYDRNRSTGEIRPCLDQAEKTEVLLGDVSLANGQAQVSVADLPVGENWVWAEYDSADGATKVVSAPTTLTVRVPVSLHVEQGSIATLSNLPDIAVTLTDATGAPIGNAGFATPASHGAIQQSTATVAFHIPLPPPPPVQSTLLGSIAASGTVTFSGSNMYSGTLSVTRPPGSGTLSGSTNIVSSGAFKSSSDSILNIGGYVSQWDHVSYQVPLVTGTVTFREGDQILGSTVIGSSTGQAVFRPQSLSLGHHTITVSYDGDDSFVAADTQTVELDVTRTPVVVSLATSQAEVLQGRDFSLTATVTTAQPDFVVPHGTISIFCDDQLLTTATLGGDSATLTTTLPAGAHQVKAVYSGDDACVAGESPAITQTVLANIAPIGRMALDSSGKLTAWAVDMDATAKSLWCDVLVDGQYVRTVKAREFRTDIAAKLSGRGAHGLTVNLPTLKVGQHLVQLMARDAQTGTSTEIGRVSVVAKRRVMPATTPGQVSVKRWLANIQSASTGLPAWWKQLGKLTKGA